MLFAALGRPDDRHTCAGLAFSRCLSVAACLVLDLDVKQRYRTPVSIQWQELQLLGEIAKDDLGQINACRLPHNSTPFTLRCVAAALACPVQSPLVPCFPFSCNILGFPCDVGRRPKSFDTAASSRPVSSLKCPTYLAGRFGCRSLWLSSPGVYLYTTCHSCLYVGLVATIEPLPALVFVVPSYTMAQALFFGAGGRAPQ